MSFIYKNKLPPAAHSKFFFLFLVVQLLARSKCRWLIQLVNALTWLRYGHDEATLSHWVVVVIKKLALCARASVWLISKVWKRHSESAKHPVVFTHHKRTTQRYTGHSAWARYLFVCPGWAASPKYAKSYKADAGGFWELAQRYQRPRSLFRRNTSRLKGSAASVYVPLLFSDYS